MSIFFMLFTFLNFYHNLNFFVIPAKAGIQFDFELKPKMDSRFRGNNESGCGCS